jgi:hypothetical protein
MLMTLLPRWKRHKDGRQPYCFIQRNTDMHAKRKFMRNQPRKQNLIAQTRRQRLNTHTIIIFYVLAGLVGMYQ